jgi:hypothetical protein
MVELMVACCDCLEPIYINYTNCSLTINNLDNSGAEPIVTLSNTFSKDAFGIKVVINNNENICKVKTNKSFFFQSAYATSCHCPPELQYLPIDSISSVKVTTNKDFDSQHSENSDVSEYFFVFSGNEFYKIEENIVKTFYDFNNSKLEFDLLLMTPPTIGKEHQFKVTIELSDGRTLNAQTDLLELN